MAVAVDNGYEVFTEEQIASYAKDFITKSQSNSIFESQKEEFAVEMAGLQKAICLAEDGKETTLYYRKPLVDWKIDDNGIVMKGIAGIYTDTMENRKLDRVGKSYIPDPAVVKSIYGSETGSGSDSASVDEAMSAQAASIKKSCAALIGDADRRLAAEEIDEEVCKAVKSDISSYFQEWGEVLDECGDVIKSTDYDDVKEDLADATAAFADIVKAAHGRYKDTAKNRRLHRVGQEYGKAASEEKKDKPTEKQVASDKGGGSSQQEYYSKLKDFFDSADKKESLGNLKSLAKKFEKDPKGQLKVLKALQAFKAGASVDEAIKFADDSMEEFRAMVNKVKERTYSEGLSSNYSKKLLDAAFSSFEDIPYKKSDVNKDRAASEEKKENLTISKQKNDLQGFDDRQERDYYTGLKEFFDSADNKKSLSSLKSLAKKYEPIVEYRDRALKALQAFKDGATPIEAARFAEYALKVRGDLFDKLNQRAREMGYPPRRILDEVNRIGKYFEDLPYEVFKTVSEKEGEPVKQQAEKSNKKQVEQSEEERKAAEKRARRQERRRERHARKREEAAKAAKAAEEAKAAEQDVKRKVEKVGQNDKKEVFQSERVKEFIKSGLDQKVYRSMRNFLDDFYGGGDGSHLKVSDYLNNGDFIEEVQKHLPADISLKDLGRALESSVRKNIEAMENMMTVKEVEDVIADGEITFGPISEILDRIKAKGVATTAKDIRDGLLQTYSLDGAYSDSVYVSIPGVFNHKAQMNGLNGGDVRKLYELQLTLKNGKTYRDFNQGKVNSEDIESAYLVRHFPKDKSYYEEDKNLDLNHLPIDIAPLR